MRVINIKVLPDGHVRQHWFVRSDKGPIQTPQGTSMTALGPVTLGGAKGYIACDPKKTSVEPGVHDGEIFPCIHSDDPRAATCPECQAVYEYAPAIAKLEGK